MWKSNVVVKLLPTRICCWKALASDNVVRANYDRKKVSGNTTTEHVTGKHKIDKCSWGALISKQVVGKYSDRQTSFENAAGKCGYKLCNSSAHFIMISVSTTISIIVIYIIFKQFKPREARGGRELKF